MVDWKKEITLSGLGRKGRDGEDAGEGAAPAPAQARPWWKKEIGGRRAGPKAPKAAPAAGDAVPFWKKEVTLGRRRTAAVEEAVAAEKAAVAAFVAAPAPAPEPAPAEAVPVAAEPVAPDLEDEYGWLTADIGGAVEPPAAAELVEPFEDPGPGLDLPAAPPVAAAPEPAVAAAPEPAVAAAPEPVVAAEPVGAAGPEPVLPPDAVVPEPAPPVAPPSAPTLGAGPSVPAPLPGVHPPVPASALPPLPAERTSFLKREISFRRRPKASAPEAKGESGSTPFWRRELSLGRRRAPAVPAGAVAEQPPAPAAEKAPPSVPFWKRELGRKRAAASPTDAPPKRKAPKAPKTPRERSPRRERGGHRPKKLVGLKVGGSQVAAARVANNGSAQLLQVARQPLEPGIVVGGELRDPDALAEALKAFFRKHKLPKRGVRLGIATNRIGVRSFDLEGIEDPRQLDNAIRFRAQEALPIPVEEAVLDYHVLSETPSAEGAPVRRVLLVVAYRELIDRYLDACRKAGIRLVGIDLEAFALLRALGAPRSPDEPPAEAATVAVAVGYDRSTFAVSDGRVCEFTRVLEWGGFAVNVALARALDVAPSEAEPVKRALTLDGDEVPDGLTAEQAAAAREAMRKQVGSFARELVSSLQFYQSQPGSLGIAGITITGGTSHLPGLAAELERLLGVPVAVGDPLARVRVGRKVQAGEGLGSFAVAIGLGIED